MCGIVGYIGNNTENTIIDKLKKLEYRGYDSAGIAVLNKKGYRVFKAKGEINNLEKVVEINKDSKIGIGHTRWATHGKPTEENAHPHVSEDNRWALVHNGIIENYLELKDKLIASGMTFYSQTDSETVAKLLQYYDGKDKLITLEKTLNNLKGSYALAILNEDTNGIFFAKNKSPLFIALNNGKALLASDIICFNGFATEYYVIEDGEYGFTDGKKLIVKNRLGVVGKSPCTFDCNVENVENVYDHYMIKEIFDTEKALKSNLEYYLVEDNLKKLSSLNIKNYNKVVFIGCGTAYNACLIGAKYFREYLDIDCFTDVASEFRYSHPKLDDKTLVILVSQSGETADTLAALELAKEHKSTTIGVVNVEYSTIAKNVDISLPIKAGVEVAVASTKAYSCQVLTMYIASLVLKATLNNEKADLKSVKEFCDNFSFGKLEKYKEIAETLRYQNKIFMIGRGMDCCTAYEASLKIKETCYINSDTYFAGELKHGFLALIDDMTYVVVFATEKEVVAKTLSNAEEAYSRGAKIILFTSITDMDKAFMDKCSFIVKIKDVNCGLQAITNIVPWQFIAYYTSVSKGINPDRPRNLAKSVTVE